MTREAYKDGAEFGYNKANEELEQKISVLLSCKNCPENKDGLICQKEYEGKCLAQKIQYIKELKEENAELTCQMKRNFYCYSCINATERCYKKEIGCPCGKYKSYKDELEKEKCELPGIIQGKDKVIKDLEWHFVKDGDLPKENEYIMIYSKLADNIAVGKRRCAGKIRKRCVYEWYFATYEGTYCLRDKDVIAWKELPELPKEIKEK